MLHYDSQNHVRPLYNGLYTQRWKEIHNISAQETHSPSLEATEAVVDKLNSSDSRLAGGMLPPCGLKLTLQQVYLKKGQLALVLLHNWSSSDGDIYIWIWKKSVTSLPYEHCKKKTKKTKKNQMTVQCDIFK